MTARVGAVDLAAAREQWAPDRPYLNTASYGLPPRVAWDALQAALADWRHGRTSWEPWGESTARARAAFARLVGVEAETVATGATASELVGLAAAAARDGAEVLVAERDFASLTFPWAVQERRLNVREAPVHELADAVRPGTSFVAFSAVQSAGGEVADLAAIRDAARAVGALTVVDATQACGWLPLRAGDFDAVIVAGYKWLMAPRGTAYMYASEALQEQLRPLHAGWWAAEDPHTSYYGLPPRLAGSARRFATSPAWFSWVGAAPALELVEQIGIEAIHAHDVGLANRFRAGLGLEPSDSAIVSADVAGADERLRRASVLAATRAGSLRASFHLYNTDQDVDAALEALT